MACSASDFAFLYRDWMALAPNAASISRRSLQRKCDYCKTPTVAECGLCGEACCSRACMLKLGKDHRRECEMVHENCGNIACVLTTFEMKDGLTPEEFKAATGGREGQSEQIICAGFLSAAAVSETLTFSVDRSKVYLCFVNL